MTSVALRILQSAIVLAFAPLYAGALACSMAIVQPKRVPSFPQPYRELGKLLREGSVIPENASRIFRIATFVVFSCYMPVSAIVPIITDEPLPLAFLTDLFGFMIAFAALNARSNATVERGTCQGHGRVHRLCVALVGWRLLSKAA